MKAFRDINSGMCETSFFTSRLRLSELSLKIDTETETLGNGIKF